MPDAGSAATGVTIGGTLKWMWDNREWIEKQLGSLAFWVKEPNDRPILILSPGGCGKTTLLRIVAGHRDWLRETPWVYAESTRKEKLPLEDDPDVQVVVTPGQPHREKTYWQELQSEIAAGKYRGVILLAAYGYHTLGQGMRIRTPPCTSRAASNRRSNSSRATYPIGETMNFGCCVNSRRTCSPASRRFGC